jgi:hypothetical protein
MYRSLLKHGGNFHLWIICFDDLGYQILEKLNLDKVTLVSLAQFEDPELLRVKKERQPHEYCWTCTPSTALYVLNSAPYVDCITYLDADLMFFSSPEPIFTELKDASIGLTEHRYIPTFDQSIPRGIYNVQFMVFKRDDIGLKALNWWRDRCLEWCYDRIEDNKFGDQKYLDDWKERFSGVKTIEHLGAGVAPWNVSQYSLNQIDSQVYLETEPLIFYHYHALKLHDFNIGYCTHYAWNYGLNKYYPWNYKLKKLIYQPYFQKIAKSYQELRGIYPKFNKGIVSFLDLPHPNKKSYKLINFIFKEIIRGKYYKYA